MWKEKARTYIPPVNPATALRVVHYEKEGIEKALGTLVIDLPDK